MIFSSLDVYGESDITNALKENLIPLKTTESENGFEDLMPLQEILKDKKIVGMGEATHGTAEFFQMKHRVFEFLVEEMGYRAFGIEAQFGGSQVVNDYILHGEGSVDDSLKAMGFWTWNTEEVADMIEWMRQFNLKAKSDDKIRFYGFDMQGIEYSLKYILNYLESVDPDSLDDYKIGSKLAINKFYQPNKGSVNILNRDIDNIYNEMTKNRDTYIKNSSIEEYELILRHIEIIYQWIDNTKDSHFNKRDYYMAENVKWILDYENQHYGNDKIVLWAHNGHVSNGYNQYINMGENLKNFFNEDYYSIGFDFYQGNFVAVPYTYFYGMLANFHIESTPEGSFAYEMMKTDIPISFLDIENEDRDNELTDFLNTKIHVNSIGALYPGKRLNISPDNEMALKDTFDGMIFVESTNASKISRITSLPNGNNALILSTIITITLIIGVVIVSFKFIKREKSEIHQNNPKKYYILEKVKGEKLDLNIVEKYIIRVNNKVNSLSSLKFIAFAMIIISIINILLIQSDHFNLYQGIYQYQGIFTLLNIAVNTIIKTIKVLVVFILPLILIKLNSNKEIYLRHILIAAIIGAAINTIGYRHSGILLYFYKFILNIIEGFLLCYSYSLFYYKWRKPIINISIILALHNIVMVILTMIVDKF